MDSADDLNGDYLESEQDNQSEESASESDDEVIVVKKE